MHCETKSNHLSHGFLVKLWELLDDSSMMKSFHLDLVQNIRNNLLAKNAQWKMCLKIRTIHIHWFEFIVVAENVICIRLNLRSRMAFLIKYLSYDWRLYRNSQKFYSSVTLCYWHITNGFDSSFEWTFVSLNFNLCINCIDYATFNFKKSISAEYQNDWNNWFGIVCTILILFSFKRL